MARKTAVWGIDIGQCALKALKARPHDEDKSKIVAEAFDYVEYPKVLSQPDADPAELVKEALKVFLSRNKVRGEKVVISVPGQAGLARFIKLPPVESSRIPDIVKYEAKQQIPFPLTEVVWDYQQLRGGSVEEGFALETEVGLFAMKREQVYKALKPFTDAGIEVSIVQLAPLAIYNLVVFDQLRSLPPADHYDPDEPPESYVVLSMGTDTSDLVVTNGFRVWQRSLPIGGSHFTKALMKEMKSTFATAEHLKRNASKAEDPKALFQAMRPVFNELATELQRSISYFTNLDRRAKIGRVIALGNALKLPGLQRFLGQNLGIELARLEGYRGLTGPGVVDAPIFKDNLLSFAVCYGLVLEGLGSKSVDAELLETNLLPPEIIQERKIRAKKPWVLAAAALLLIGLTTHFASHWRNWDSVRMPDYFEPKARAADALDQTAQGYLTAYREAKDAFLKSDEVGRSFLQNVQFRALWLELFRATTACLPQNPPADKPPDVTQRQDIKITGFECKHYDQLETWWNEELTDKERAAYKGEGDVVDAGPTGPGWVIQLRAHHFRNQRDDANSGPTYVRNTLIKKLREGEQEIMLPVAGGKPGETKAFKIRDLGLKYPVLVETGNINWENTVEVEDPTAAPGPGGQVARKQVNLPRYDFLVQYCWQVVTPEERGKLAPAPATDATAGVPAGR